MRKTVRAVAAGAAVLGAVLALSVGTTGSASASDEFGQHVRTHAQEMGFSGNMNPGMHQGFHGWDGTCMCM